MPGMQVVLHAYIQPALQQCYHMFTKDRWREEEKLNKQRWTCLMTPSTRNETLFHLNTDRRPRNMINNYHIAASCWLTAFNPNKLTAVTSSNIVLTVKNGLFKSGTEHRIEKRRFVTRSTKTKMQTVCDYRVVVCDNHL